jgi:aromatic ring-cleaving dioxygenase
MRRDAGASPSGKAPVFGTGIRRFESCRPSQFRKHDDMTEPSIQNFHAHIYYDPEEVERAKALAVAAQGRFGVAVGHFHLRPVGPHPRGSCQLTVATEQFGDFAQWAALNRGGLTIFAHTETGDDLADHTEHVIWFGPSEPLDLSIFG